MASNADRKKDKIEEARKEPYAFDPDAETDLKREIGSIKGKILRELADMLEQDETSDTLSGTRVKHLVIDSSDLLGFFVKDKDGVKEFGQSVMQADIVMDTLDSDDITEVIKKSRKDLAKYSTKELEKCVGGAALVTLLGLARLNYIAERKSGEE